MKVLVISNEWNHSGLKCHWGQRGTALPLDWGFVKMPLQEMNKVMVASPKHHTSLCSICCLSPKFLNYPWILEQHLLLHGWLLTGH